MQRRNADWRKVLRQETAAGAGRTLHHFSAAHAGVLRIRFAPVDRPQYDGHGGSELELAPPAVTPRAEDREPSSPAHGSRRWWAVNHLATSPPHIGNDEHPDRMPDVQIEP